MWCLDWMSDRRTFVCGRILTEKFFNYGTSHYSKMNCEKHYYGVYKMLIYEHSIPREKYPSYGVSHVNSIEDSSDLSKLWAFDQAGREKEQPCLDMGRLAFGKLAVSGSGREVKLVRKTERPATDAPRKPGYPIFPKSARSDFSTLGKSQAGMCLKGGQ